MSQHQEHYIRSPFGYHPTIVYQLTVVECFLHGDDHQAGQYIDKLDDLEINSLAIKCEQIARILKDRLKKGKEDATYICAGCRRQWKRREQANSCELSHIRDGNPDIFF